jgi:hypothetical protein
MTRGFHNAENALMGEFYGIALIEKYRVLNASPELYWCLPLL